MKREADTTTREVLAMFVPMLGVSAATIVVWQLAGWSKELLGTAIILATTPAVILTLDHYEKPRRAAERRERND